MNQEIKDRWIGALESGAYRQGFGLLHQVSNDDTELFCCLGVLSDIAYRDGVVARRHVDVDNANVSGYIYGSCGMAALPNEVVEWAGLSESNPRVTYRDESRQLAYLNDELRLPFADVAIVIKESL